MQTKIDTLKIHINNLKFDLNFLRSNYHNYINKNQYYSKYNKIAIEVNIKEAELFLLLKQQKKEKKLKLWQNINRLNRDQLTGALMIIYSNQIEFNANIIHKIPKVIKQQTINKLKSDFYKCKKHIHNFEKTDQFNQKTFKKYNVIPEFKFK
jgi:hypothetical protein